MKCDVILAGVGGQGVLSIAAIIAQAAVSEGLAARQSEVHGMAQRGGAVLAHLRISDTVIASDLVPKGGADIIISMEPLECLRYAAWLNPAGVVVTAAEPLVNIGNYPELPEIIAAVKGFPRQRIIEAAGLAKEAGLAKAVNMVMVGAASPFLPIAAQALENAIAATFAAKDTAIVTANTKAFQLGKRAAENPSAGVPSSGGSV
ncbi:MAG: indolepyruvate oxidoreductase subunit beta [Treponema sp.]|nr:indolepyruvate oxidoreductase subunit beta [Treponema sp.]